MSGNEVQKSKRSKTGGQRPVIPLTKHSQRRLGFLFLTFPSPQHFSTFAVTHAGTRTALLLLITRIYSEACTLVHTFLLLTMDIYQLNHTSPRQCSTLDIKLNLVNIDTVFVDRGVLEHCAVDVSIVRGYRKNYEWSVLMVHSTLFSGYILIDGLMLSRSR